MKSNVRFHVRRSQVLSMIGLLVTLLLAGCSSLTSTSTATLAPAKVNVQLSWVHTIEWAGFYVAEDKGYFAEQALTVNLQPGGEDAQGNYLDAIDVMLKGGADFGVASGGNLIQARANNAPVVAIASIYQRHPMGFTSLAEKNITKPQDLIGKKIQIAPNSHLLLQAMLTASGVDPALIKTEERTDFTTAPLINGDADVIDTFITNEVVTLKLEGYEINNLLPVEYGVEEYPNVIFTTEKMIKEHPDVVERFLRATLRGIETALAEPHQIAALAIRHDDSLEEAKEAEAMFQSVPLLNPTGSKPGMMTAEAWNATYTMLLDQKVLKQPMDVKTVYTLAFLEKIYAQ